MPPGDRFELVRPPRGGFQSGAWLIEDDAGRQTALKWTPNRMWAEQIIRASQAVPVIRRHYYPTPAIAHGGDDKCRFRLPGPEYAPGRPREYLTEEPAHDAVEVLDLQSSGPLGVQRAPFIHGTSVGKRGK